MLRVRITSPSDVPCTVYRWGEDGWVIKTACSTGCPFNGFVILSIAFELVGFGFAKWLHQFPAPPDVVTGGGKEMKSTQAASSPEETILSFIYSQMKVLVPALTG